MYRINSISFGHKIHPVVRFFINDIADCIAATNTSLHFIDTHKAANNIIKNQGGQSSDIFIKHPNIHVKNNVNTYWNLLETAQATAMGLPVVKEGVITGTIKEMRQVFPNEKFPANQPEPDVLQNFHKSNYPFQGSLGTDWKFGKGKTQVHGRNQVVITTLNDYKILLEKYANDLGILYNNKAIKAMIEELRTHANNNSFSEQVDCLARYMHLFPPKWIPPLFMSEKFPIDSLTSEIKLKVAQSLRKLRWLSKQAYEKNIPEDIMDGSFIQGKLNEEIPTDFY